MISLFLRLSLGCPLVLFCQFTFPFEYHGLLQSSATKVQAMDDQMLITAAPHALPRLRPRGIDTWGFVSGNSSKPLTLQAFSGGYRN